MRALEEATEIVKRKWPKSRGWKVVCVVGIIVAGLIGLVALVLWLLGRLVKGLTVGGYRNMGLYYPRMGRRSR